MAIKYFFLKHLNLKPKKSISIKEFQEGADFIDYILLNLEAGTHVEQSFFQAIDNIEPGLLKKCSQHILKLCRLGFSFGEAINQVLALHTTGPVLYEILENLSLSLRLGSPLIQILNHLSFHFRLLATSRLEELANEAPVKMIFPLVIFIFPVIFILLGSGAIENLVRSFNF